jgi:hypothetical protein
MEPMLPGRLRPFAAFWVCAAVLCLTSQRMSRTSDTWAADVLPPLVTPASVLPAGLAPPRTDGRLLVSVIAADIDADGDLDVVGSDGSLDLIVWDNDGTGHLTRKDPQPSTPDGWESSGATVDDRPATSTVAAQFGGTSLRLNTRALSFNSHLSPWRAAASPSHRQPQFALTRIPRAPPASFLFV